MKILMCYPQTYDWEETGKYFHEAFIKLGHTVFVFDDVRYNELFGSSEVNRLLLKFYESVKPDIFFMLKSSSIYPSVLDSIKCKKVYYHPDVREKVQDWVVSKAIKCDNFFTMSKGSVKEYKSKGVNVTYLPEACSPKYHYPISSNNISDFFKSDINFIGTVRDNRIDMLNVLDANNFDFKIFGGNKKFLSKYINLFNKHTGVSLWNEKHSFAASNSISVTYDWCPSVELSYSARIYRVMASKGLYLCKYVNGMEKVFTRGVHLDWYNNFNELVDKVNFYLKHPEKRDRIGENAQKIVYKYHTFDNRVKRMFEVMK